MINDFIGLVKLSRLVNLLPVRSYSIQHSSKKWSSTVFVPKSELSNRRTPKSEIEFLQKPCFRNLYRDQLARNSDRKFVLHDGPPYANGSVHFGHVINKTLKDIICRYKIRQGYKVEFVPGWDCHGLPIELKVYKESEQQSMSTLTVREKARKFACSTIKDQIKVFRRMGIAADWDKPYTTFSNELVSNQLEAFKNLFQKGLIHRSFLPIYFSPSNKTTLAESELEYNLEHISPSILFQFKVNHNFLLKSNFDAYALIWTTTPWTLPANQAIAFSPNIKYVLASATKLSRYFILAEQTIPEIEIKIGAQLVEEKVLNNQELESLSYSHPIRADQKSPFLSADYVTISKGTGLVHCAPNHGREDFDLARKYGLPNNDCLVDDDGNFIAGIHPKLDGKSVLDEGSNLVMDLLSKEILHRENFVHSYPYDWRSGKPVIIKTSRQWFVDVAKIRDKCLSSLSEVAFLPPGIKNKICDEISSRPAWCISRQRIWGVPIPVFYHINDPDRSKPIVSSQSINHLIEFINKNGADVWWKLTPSELLPDNVCQSLQVNPNELVTGHDIFDVWFDSGMTWNSVLNDDRIADIYLEGVDQCHGWFQTSLILSVALRDKAPYKSVYVHGFAVDSEGHKMSKSIGNVVDPLPLIETIYGSDVLRLFIARYGSHHGNIKVDNEKLKSTAALLQKFRNTLKFCLGSMKDFDVSSDYSVPDLVNQYMLNQLWSFNQLCQHKYNENDFRSLIIESSAFLDDFSSFYLKIIKDSLYCDSLDSKNRRSSQHVIHYLLETFNNFLSPILPFLFEEINLIRTNNDNASSLFLQKYFECPSAWKNDQISLAMGIIRRIKETIDVQTEDVKHFGKPFTAHIFCHREFDHEVLMACQPSPDYSLEPELAKILQLSDVKLSRPIDLDTIKFDTKISCEEDFPFTILLSKATKQCCPRCRHYLTEHPEELCPRCHLVVNK